MGCSVFTSERATLCRKFWPQVVATWNHFLVLRLHIFQAQWNPWAEEGAVLQQETWKEPILQLHLSSFNSRNASFPSLLCSSHVWLWSASTEDWDSAKLPASLQWAGLVEKLYPWESGAQAVPSHLAEAVASYNIVIEVTCKNNYCKNMYTCKYIAGPESIPRHTMELNGGMFVPEFIYFWNMFDLTRFW